MDIIIRNSGGVPIYDQITRQMKGLILRGELKEGEALPSMRLLAKELRISVITTKRAYDELEADGFLYTVAGKGCFVAEKNLDLIREQKLKELEEKAAAGTMSAAELENQKKAMELVEKYEAAMEDDFNTADAVSAVFELVKLSNSTASAESTGAYVGWMKETIERLCGVLGIITEKKEEILDSEIEDMIAQRQAARKAKDFALADQIRGKLLDMGIILEDTREGVKWELV